MNTKEAHIKLSMLCSRKEYCVSDVQKKMDSWKIPISEQKQIIKNLISEKFIDESRFAEAFVKDKFRFNKWGKIKIRYQLKQKGIADILITRALEGISVNDYQDTIRELLKAKNRALRAKDEYERKMKLLRFMVQRGFEYETLNHEIEDLFKNIELD